VKAALFDDSDRDVRYAVVYNNTRFYLANATVKLAGPAPGEKALDMFALREVPMQGGSFEVAFQEGNGRIYAIGAADALEEVRREVFENRIEAEKGLLEVEIQVAERMGTKVATARQRISEAENLRERGEFRAGLEKLGEGMDVLRQQARANDAFWPVHRNLEEARSSLGRVHELMNRRMNDAGFGSREGDVKDKIEAMKALGDRFYSLQSDLYGNGPEGLQETARELRDDVLTFERKAAGFFGT
jgi:hypothetical protein